MRILFVLPGYARHPSGGFKVIYEHAVQLSRLHHEVSIVHADVIFNGVPFREYPIRIGGLAMRRMHLTRKPGAWYAMDGSVRMLTVPSLAARHIPDADVIVATSWHTAEFVVSYPSKKGAKVYFVQDYEHLMTVPDTIRKRMVDTYRSGFTMVTISPVMQEFLHSIGVESTLIENALDHDVFFMEIPLDDPSREWIGFPYRVESFKGTEDVLTCLDILKNKSVISDRVWAFGSVKKPSLPGWIQYVYLPEDQELRAWYNRSKIFVVGSHFEGWGLPGMEAMTCGAALVTTDNGGARAYARDGVNSLISPPQEPQTLANNVRRLMDHEPERLALASAGVQCLSNLTWRSSSARLATIIESAPLKSTARNVHSLTNTHDGM